MNKRFDLEKSFKRKWVEQKQKGFNPTSRTGRGNTKLQRVKYIENKSSSYHHHLI